MMQKMEQVLRKTITEGKLIETALPLCPDISLHLLSPDFPRGRLEQDQVLAIIDSPAYWAFCWASGQVLANYILSHPSEFNGKSVLDFGSGSGVVAIAAARAGAKQVIACDNDPDALIASRQNALLNKVNLSYLDDITGLDQHMDIIIAADVLYDRDNICWLDKLPAMATEILLADSRVKNIELHGYKIVERITATTIPDLDEYREFNDVKVYRSVAA